MKQVPLHEYLNCIQKRKDRRRISKPSLSDILSLIEQLAPRKHLLRSCSSFSRVRMHQSYQRWNFTVNCVPSASRVKTLMVQENLQPTGFPGFDEPALHEEALLEDLCPDQESFPPEHADDFLSQEPNRDELFDTIRELDSAEVAPSPRNENQSEPLSEDGPEVPNVLNALGTLDILLHPLKDTASPKHDPELTEGDQVQDHLLNEDFSSPVNVISAMLIEEPFALNTALLMPDTINYVLGGQKRMGTSVSQSVSSLTPAAVPQEEEMVDAPSENMDLVQSNSGMKGKVHDIQVEKGLAQITRRHYLDSHEGSLTPGMFPEVFNHDSIEGDPAQINAYAINTADMPPPQRQRTAELRPTSFSKSVEKPLNLPRVNLESSKQRQPAAEGTKRLPKKRTRTRIEDMDPSMVHICNFPGCTKKFAKKYNLKIHQRRHNGDLPFLCEYAGCAKRFMWLSSFSRHLRVHEARRNSGRKRREVQIEPEGPHSNDALLEREPDIVISENFSIFSISGVKLFVENELSADVTSAYALTALDSKPCEKLIPAAKIAQAKRRQLLCTGRSEEFYQQQAMPFDMNNLQLQNFCQLLAATPDPQVMIDDFNAACDLDVALRNSPPIMPCTTTRDGRKS